MSLLKRILGKTGIANRDGGSLENPAVSFGSALWSFLSGGEPTPSGELVSEANAMQLLTVYVCVRILAEGVAGIPLLLHEILASGKREAVDNPLYELLTGSPNEEMTAFTFLETITTSMAYTGNSYVRIDRNNVKEPVQLWPLEPSKTEPYRNSKGVLRYRTRGTTGNWEYIDAADMLHCKLLSFDGVKGLSPISLAKATIGMGKAAENYGARWFGNGGTPPGVLSTVSDLKPEQVKNASTTWRAAQGGVNQGKTAVLYGDWRYQAIGVSPEESQFLLTQAYNRTQLAALFRLDPHFVGDTSRLSNANHEQISLALVTDTLMPYLTRIKQECNRKLLPRGSRFRFGFDLRERLRGDFKTTMEGMALGKQNGWYNSDDVLRELGENPIGGPAGQAYWRPVNMVDASKPYQIPAPGSVPNDNLKEGKK